MDEVKKIEKEVVIVCESDVSKKTGNLYYKLYVDLGYTKKVISWNVSDIAEILGLSVPDLVSRLGN